METRNCMRCGKLFAYQTVPICEACVKLDEEEFQIVRKYVKENRGSTIKMVSDATGISSKRVARFIREGKIDDDVEVSLSCEKCGRPISKGRLCQDCISSMTNAMESIMHRAEKPVKAEETASSKSIGMHLSKFNKDKD